MALQTFSTAREVKNYFLGRFVYINDLFRKKLSSTVYQYENIKDWYDYHELYGGRIVSNWLNYKAKEYDIVYTRHMGEEAIFHNVEHKAFNYDMILRKSVGGLEVGTQFEEKSKNWNSTSWHTSKLQNDDLTINPKVPNVITVSYKPNPIDPTYLDGFVGIRECTAESWKGHNQKTPNLYINMDNSVKNIFGAYSTSANGSKYFISHHSMRHFGELTGNNWKEVKYLSNEEVNLEWFDKK